MPDWKTHLIFSLFLVIAWMFIFQNIGMEIGARQMVPIVTLSVFVSLFPDVDVKSSKIRDVTSLLISFTALVYYVISYPVTWYYGPVYFILLYMILKYIPTRHRGMTHMLNFAIIFSAVLAWIYVSLAENSVAMVGTSELIWFLIILSNYSLHLVLDRI